MFGPRHSEDATGDRSRSRRDELGEVFTRADADETAGECELCETETRTSREYGMRVCRSCERELLP